MGPSHYFTKYYYINLEPPRQTNSLNLARAWYNYRMLNREVFAGSIFRSRRPNIVEASSAIEADRKADFSIRGHRLWEQSWLLKGRYDEQSNSYRKFTPVELAQFIVTSLKTDRRLINHLRQYGLLSTEDIQDLRYFKDYMGSNDSEAVEFVRRKTATFEEFTALGDDVIVEITAKKDTTCDTCPLIGDHCTTSADTFGKEGGTRFARDLKGIALVAEEATRLGLRDQIVTVTQVTDYTDRDPVEYLALRMRSEVLKRILSESEVLTTQLSGPEEAVAS